MDKKIIITVGRQIGSGGHDVARLLADMFHCRFYDRELLNLAAKESGFCEKFFEQNDEHKGFFKSMFQIHGSFAEGSFYRNEFSQATPSYVRPTSHPVCSWAVAPTMCCATCPTRSTCSSPPTSTTASAACQSARDAPPNKPARPLPMARATARHITIITRASAGDIPTATTCVSIRQYSVFRARQS